MKVDLQRFTGMCDCGREHSITVKEIFIEAGATAQLGRMLEGYRHPVIVCDRNTRVAAEPVMAAYFEKYEVAQVEGEDIHANDVYVEILDGILSSDADLLVAVGAGTIHDLTRYTAYKRGLQFISVPTAASVDGFVSTVAAMTWHGMKKTLPADHPPVRQR